MGRPARRRETMTTKWTVGDHILAGETEEDREDGKILEIDGNRALIAWRQGTRTWIDLAYCEVA